MLKTQIFNVLVTLLILYTTVSLTSSAAVISPELLQNENQTQTIVINFNRAGGMDRVFASIENANFSSIAEKRTALTIAQQEHTFKTQHLLQIVLTGLGMRYESFWINNKMVVYDCNSSVIQTVAGFPGVDSIQGEPPTARITPFQVNQIGGKEERRGFLPPQLLWHVKEIRAPEVWEQNFKGKGIVVASIDSGVRHTHEALANGWRSEYGWYDPLDETETPNDVNGHGTHTTGSVSGNNGIGIAPESTWIACKACSQQLYCNGIELWKCGQFVQCPTKPDGSDQDCFYAPDIVVNSWGSPQPGDWYDDVIKSWKVAEIIPVFASGNTGSNCSTLWYPGDRKDVIGVGATTPSGQLWQFSSRGPSTDEDVVVKPDLVAPGQWIHSSWPSADWQYATYTGTSMACPVVAGVIALMKSKQPSLNYQQIYDIITETTEESYGIDTSTAETCGGTPPDVFPNNLFGYGRVDALRAVNSVQSQK